MSFVQAKSIHGQRRSRHGDSAADVAPGKATRVVALQRRAAEGQGGPNGQKQGPTDSDTLAIASNGVAGASAPLPFLGPITESFGHHDVSEVKTQTGGAATQASAAIGAQAYATGDRVAFASEPDLHTAAHEAAHVVQQRAGVQLKGGVGASGDVYEQHADRVADLVVQGKSAESALDEFAGGGQKTAVQRFDSPHHVAIGDSVAGESVTVNEVTFTPGQLAALVDYVGHVENLKDYTTEDLQEMKSLLMAGSEDVADWDRVTGGNYSKESQANEKHFAPDPDGGGGTDNFRAQYIEHFSNAIRIAQLSRSGDLNATMDDARLHMYTAEHYIEDAFSAGHQISAAPIEKAVMETISWSENTDMVPRITAATFARCSDIISQYDMASLPETFPLEGPEWVPIDTVDRFQSIAVPAGVWLAREATVDAVRQFIHERLGEDMGVEVSSQAHPEPWVLLGDHDIERSPESIRPLQAALAATRAELTAAALDADPVELATRLFDKHCPIPTPNGEANVLEALLDATESAEAIEEAVIESSCHTIQGIMDFTALYPVVRKRTDLKTEPAPFPEIPRHNPETGLDPDLDRDSDDDRDVDVDG